MRVSISAIQQRQKPDFSSSLLDPLSSIGISLPNLDKANRVAHERRRILASLDEIRNLVTVTPLGDPDDFFRGSRDEPRPCKLWHTAIDDDANLPSFLLESSRVERHRISPPIGKQ